MSVVRYNKVNYELTWGEMYGFYGDEVRLLDVRKREGVVVFKFKSGCQEGRVNECEIEEFAIQNPEIVLKKGEERGKDKWVYAYDEEGY